VVVVRSESQRPHKVTVAASRTIKVGLRTTGLGS
jgi:hypothetical protein